ncbi:MAG: TRAP transporter large permease [Deltaproteobacteria bacterium]|nr:TRAP transporter large permease [Deltaproteobacteria bacterium]
MSGFEIGIIGVIFLLLLMILRMPIAFSMLISGLAGLAWVLNSKAGLSQTVFNLWSTFSSYDLSVVPMFVLMGSIAFYAGISGQLFNTTHKFFGRQPGGLALATIFASAGFAAVSGSSNASAAAMAKVTLPEMKKFNYNDALATGSVAAGGTLGILIPPSALFIIYGVMVQVSIGKLFLAGIVPGLLLTVLYAIVVAILCWRNPDLGPPGDASSWRDKFASLSGLVDMIVLFGLVMGGLFAGWFTPTQAGAVGAAGALVIGLIRRSLNLDGLKNSLLDTVKISVMLYFIVAGALVFGRFMTATRFSFELATWITNLAMPPAAVMGMLIIIYLIGGCFMDSLAMVTLTIPIFFPIVTTMGFDPIWFGVIIVLVAEIGVITPPVGVNVYVIKGIAPEIPLETIFRGILPFTIAVLVCIVIVLAFPQLSLFLPGLIG